MNTVKIVCEKTKDNDQGFIIINKSDLKDGDQIFGKPSAKKPEIVKQKVNK